MNDAPAGSSATFANPVLRGDFADPDVIRVGDEFWMITSTFHYSPGMALLRSTDLVHWQYAGHCIADITDLGLEYSAERMGREGGGIFAGSIREHDGRFFVYFTTWNEGLFVTSAGDMKGPWERPRLIWAEPFWDDPCPVWDDDGSGWLVLSHPGNPVDAGWMTYLMPLSFDGYTVDPGRIRVLDSTWSSEGNKVYRVDGMFYVLHNEVRSPENRVAVIMRAKSMAGPWEKHDLIASDAADRDREPNQGALVETSAEEWFFVTHHGRMGYPEGRPVSVLPVSWVDGWPVAGAIVDGRGQMDWTPSSPNLPAASTGPGLELGLSDSFDGERLSPQWEWAHQPPNDSWKLTAAGLRLEALPLLREGDLRTVKNLLTQRMIGRGSTATVEFELSDLRDGTRAGLANSGLPYGAIQLVQNAGSREVQIVVGDEENRPLVALAEPVPLTSSIKFRVSFNSASLASFSYSLDGVSFRPFGGCCETGMLKYRGNRLAVSASREGNSADAVESSVTVKRFEYLIDTPRIA